MALTGQAATTTMLTPSTPGGVASKQRISTGIKNSSGLSHSSGYPMIKAASEGGDKRMLDVIFERLKHTIHSEWTEGRGVSKILDTFEDVTITPPARLTSEEKKDELHRAIWAEKVKRHVIKVDALEDAKGRLYSTIWKLLSKVMQSKLSGQTGFSKRNDACDVVWLIQKVRALVTDFDSAMPEVLSVNDALERIITFRQSERMDNAEYVRCLLALVKVYEQYCGPYGVHLKESKRIDDKLSAIVDEDDQPLDEETKKERRAEAIRVAREKAIAMQIIKGACKRRYSSLKKNLATDYGLKINKYPNNIDDAINALNVAESQLPPHIKKLRDQNDFTFAQAGAGQLVPGTNGKIADKITCHKCKKMGHYANKCPLQDEDESKNGDAEEEP